MMLAGEEPDFSTNSPSTKENHENKRCKETKLLVHTHESRKGVARETTKSSLPITLYIYTYIKNVKGCKGEMAKWLRVLIAFPEVLSLIPSNHTVAHNHL